MPSNFNVVKSNDRSETFSESKLISALERASVPKKHYKSIISEVKKGLYDRIPSSEVRKLVISELDKIDKSYSHGFRYKKRVVGVIGGYSIAHLKDTYENFTKQRIIDSLLKETSMKEDLAKEIANQAEHFLIENNVKNISGTLIREVINYFLMQNDKYFKYYQQYKKIGMPVYDITGMINIGERENANLQYNPETIHKLIADNISRQYALTKELPNKLASAHLLGKIHIHDLDYFSTRPFCFSHDLRFFLKNGLKADGLGVHTAVTGPARNASVAVLHAAKILASSQVNCAGGQGFNWFNILLAPYLKGMNYKQIKQMAQMFIYEMSMMYVSRGGQVVFSSIDIEPGIPKTLANIPAVLPGGQVKDRVTYSDFSKEANMFFNALTDVYIEGDAKGKPFSFPKYELKVSKGDFKKYPEEMLKVSSLASKFGTPYFFVQQDYLPEYSCYQCCSFLMPLSDQTTQNDLYNGTVRGGALQVLTINLPQLAYEAKGSESRLFDLLRDRMEIAKEVLEIKKSIVKKRLAQGLLPFMSQPIDDKGTPYYLVDKQSCEIGMVGLNEMLKAHLGAELHENEAAWKFGLKTIHEMKKIAAEFGKETGGHYGISRIPAESAAYRLSKIDMRRYQNAIVQGDRKSGAVYYTNSTHIRPSADVNLIERLQKEASFHPLLDGGAMSHVWLGEGTPDPEAINKLTERIAKKTLMSYFSYTRDLTVCNECLYTIGGVLQTCPKCRSKNIDWYSRVTGYVQRVSTWNEGKKREFLDRKRYEV